MQTSKGQRDSGVGMEQYDMLALENANLKNQLGDMIEKYKLLYYKIKEMQEEQKRERQEKMEAEKARAEQSINPFSIASATPSNGGEQAAVETS